MNRKELKSNAKEVIRGNKWYLIKPILYFTLFIIIFMAATMFITSLFHPSNLVLEIVFSLSFSLVVFLSFAYSFGYAYYCLSFVRGVKISFGEIISYALNNMTNAILISFLVFILYLLGSVLLVIPGIILSLGLYFYKEVYCDNSESSIVGVLKETWHLTHGHKFELFVLILSFLGWIILAELTLGILYIWLMPYMTITFTLFYEHLIINKN